LSVSAAEIDPWLLVLAAMFAESTESFKWIRKSDDINEIIEARGETWDYSLVIGDWAMLI